MVWRYVFNSLVPRSYYYAACAFRVTWSVRLGYVIEMHWPWRPGKKPHRVEAKWISQLDFLFIVISSWSFLNFDAACAFRVTWSVRLGYVIEMHWPWRPGKKPHRVEAKWISQLDFLFIVISSWSFLNFALKRLAFYFSFVLGVIGCYVHEWWQHLRIYLRTLFEIHGSGEGG